MKPPSRLTQVAQMQKFFRHTAQSAINDRFKEINEMLKPKPKYLPRWAWKWVIKQIVDLNIYKKKGGLL